ncbi:MAG: D-2-hydroxyacid dehydrogenase family protein, partial [Alphaproteobacteria bacterium]|nr:D-2-hydroxyacid dehydrogenase family protein [Alphaproteobacteria bacterium]
TTGMRNGAIDLAAATRRGIVVSGTRGSSGSTCELTWGLILAAARHIPAADARLRQGRWTVPMGMGLEGRTLGVVGLGRIGAQVAKVGAAFGMKVMAWSRSLTHDKAAAVGVQRAELDTLLSSADVVSIHLVLAAETRGLIGRTRLETMKPGSILVNTARAAIVDEAALVDALNQGQIAAAGLDVFWVEPLPEGHALKSLDNVVLTPHLGYVTTETWRQFFADVVEDIRAFRAGNPVRLVG